LSPTKIPALCTALLLLAAGGVLASEEDTVDLRMRWIKCERAVVGEGEVVRLTARVDNNSTGRVPPFTVSFYCQQGDHRRRIGSIRYDSINYYRRPSLKWDTRGCTGNVTLTASVHLPDRNPKNNRAAAEVRVCPTHPTAAEKRVLLTRVYYHARPHSNNEFVSIHNPTNVSVNLYNWYLTDQPRRRADRQSRVVFPNLYLAPGQTITVTQNASSYARETGRQADFSYHRSDVCGCPLLERHGSFVLANSGDMVCLKDGYNHTIDTVVYGGEEEPAPGWQGDGIPLVGEGGILVRRRNGAYRDTNTSSDWYSNRTHRIGQSDFEPFHVHYNGSLTVFCSPDCSYPVVARELDRARHSIFLNLYEFTNPFLGQKVVEALARNVSVTLLLEGHPVGGLSMEERYIASRIAAAGGEVYYMAGREDHGGYRRYSFNHAKYAVIDNRTAILHSANWGHTGMPPSPTYGNREWGVVVHNRSLAAFLARVFHHDLGYGQDIVAYNSSHSIYGAPPDYYQPARWIPRGGYQPAFSSRTLNGSFGCTVILSPDNSREAVAELLASARTRVWVQQAYIDLHWEENVNPFVRRLVGVHLRGAAARVILNYNPHYTSSITMNNATMSHLEDHNVSATYVYANGSHGMNIHTKGVIVDGNRTLVSSINWNHHAVHRNREVGIIIENQQVAEYFARVFSHDWNLTATEPREIMVGREAVKALVVAAAYVFAGLALYRHWRT